MAYINTIKSANHGLINKHIKKEGMRPKKSPEWRATGGGYRYSRPLKHSPNLPNAKSIWTCFMLAKGKVWQNLTFLKF